MSSHFMPPPRSPIGNPWSADYVKMEGAKANFSTALLASEKCMKKCGLEVSEATSLDQVGTGCVRSCFTKYFDCQLLIQNEMTNFVMAQNL